MGFPRVARDEGESRSEPQTPRLPLDAATARRVSANRRLEVVCDRSLAGTRVLGGGSFLGGGMNGHRAIGRRCAASVRDDVADRHMKAAVLWRDIGQVQRAVLEVRFAIAERQLAQLERDRATLERARDRALAGTPPRSASSSATQTRASRSGRTSTCSTTTCRGPRCSTRSRKGATPGQHNPPRQAET